MIFTPLLGTRPSGVVSKSHHSAVRCIPRTSSIHRLLCALGSCSRTPTCTTRADMQSAPKCFVLQNFLFQRPSESKWCHLEPVPVSRCWIIPVHVLLHMLMVAEESTPTLRPHSSPKSVVRLCTADPSDVPLTRAMSSDSALDKATVACVVLHVQMAWRPLLVDLRVRAHPAPSMSVYMKGSLGTACYQKWMMSRGRPGKYRASRLKASASRWVGGAILRRSSFTANAMPGRPLAARNHFAEVRRCLALQRWRALCESDSKPTPATRPWRWSASHSVLQRTRLRKRSSSPRSTNLPSTLPSNAFIRFSSSHFTSAKLSHTPSSLPSIEWQLSQDVALEVIVELCSGDVHRGQTHLVR